MRVDGLPKTRYTQRMDLARLIDANVARLGEALRVIEDICRFELSNTILTNECTTIRTKLKQTCQLLNHAELVNARSTGSDVRAKSNVPKRTDLQDLITANVKRATQAARCLEEATHQQTFSHIRYDCYALEQALWEHLARAPLIGPGIYVISDSPNHLARLAQHPGVPIVQYRNKSASKSDIYTTCKALSRELQGKSALFIVNDHADIAKAVGADGVHVGQDDIPTPVIRAQLGQTKLIGRTTHSFDQGLIAKTSGADYVSVGPIWDTPSKPGRPGIGFDYLQRANELGIPFVAIGGISGNNITHVLAFNPPLIGAIRAIDNIDFLWNAISTQSSIAHQKN